MQNSMKNSMKNSIRNLIKNNQRFEPRMNNFVVTIDNSINDFVQKPVDNDTYDTYKNELDFIFKKIGIIDNFHIFESSGASIVICPIKENFGLDIFTMDNNNENQSKHDIYENVYQYFAYNETAWRIFQMYYQLHRNKIILVPCKLTCSIYQINYLDNLAQLVSYIPRNVIVWKYHTCLSSLPIKEKCFLIMNNIEKFLWDLTKALYGLCSNGIIHGDARIDNVGIYNGKFILFDFDASKKENDFLLLQTRDLSDLKSSIEFNIGQKNYEKIYDYIPIDKYIEPFFQRLPLLLRHDVLSLENLTIKYT
jgi:hypothetical protein